MATRRRLVLGIALATLCGLGAVACAPSEAGSPNGSTSPEPTPVVRPTRSTPPEPSDQQPTTPTPTAEPESPAVEGPAPVVRTPTTVEVTFGGWQAATASVEVGGYAGVVEEDGTCALQLSQGAASASATSAGAPDATTTSCGTLTIAGTSLRPGTWTGVLRYESPRTAGESKTITIEVPR